MRLAAWFGRTDVERFAEEITPQQLNAWMETGITAWPELLANGFAAICRTLGARSMHADHFRHWEPPEIVSEEVFIRKVDSAHGAK